MRQPVCHYCHARVSWRYFIMMNLAEKALALLLLPFFIVGLLAQDPDLYALYFDWYERLEHATCARAAKVAERLLR